MKDLKALTPRIEVRNCRKSFPGVLALDDVSFETLPGEIHALLGENGAGKSTLGKVIGGIYQMDSGEVLLDGEKLERLDEVTAGKLGIGIVHQEGSLVPQLSVAENIFAGRQPTGFLGAIDRRKMHRLTSKLMEDLGVSLDSAAIVETLSAAQAQVVEVAKAISRDLRLLILDEPTSALTGSETERLFDMLRRLRRSGVAVVYISHRLAEIFALCDRITVLKDGRLTGTRKVSQTSEEELIRMMVGRDVLFERAEKIPSGKVVLEIENLVSGGEVVNASLSACAGEIVCLSGLVGSGRSEVCEAVFGLRPQYGGTIRIEGRQVRFSGPRDAITAGIGMMPENRKEDGLFLSHSIAENISVTVLDKVSPHGVFSADMSNRLAKGFTRRLRIATPSIRQSVGNLSGGNQQKVLLAKWLAPSPRLLIVDEPTRGVDVGARAEIYRILTDLKADGMAILVVSSDLPEVLTLADRIVVMASGRTVGELDGASASEEDIMSLAAGTTSNGTGATLRVQERTPA